ncbi:MULTISPECIES: TlpA disulfide reductase family protein [Frigoribacterium]|uniref:TlpA disulfide reductase family protein n=1 Tax=Frigoribacterium TaxID=96492 RepID=UPI0006F4D276|nr:MULTISPECIES: TlpA disulfide reductase family protein [Frigoribacterium]KQM25708.1 alkyl hydroperoxide reductase [Frigoribacterium sp. Leaf8]ROS57432.1 thiol-disulfide isomerase/thioredoxin [Frigoribacterium sp. PhB118]WAC51178.1 TlpA disulfide reductase family protein [Frigoribacterium sp. SL97]
MSQKTIRPTRARLVVRGLALAAVLGVVATGCSSTADDLAKQYGNGTTENYISGNGTVTEIAPEDRTDPVAFTAETDAGETVSRSDHEGEVVVLNFWYAACPPCRLEAPELEKLNQSYADKGVEFLGVNVRDQADTSLAFARTFDVTYPSVVDANDGAVQLALAGTIAPNAVPTTIVLDKQGRIAARILGGLDGPGILDTLISDTLAETS